MRQLLSLLALLGVLALAAGAVWAHPPSDVKLTLDTTTHVLTVTALHPVQDPAKHYIGEIDVWINDTEIITQKFSNQTDATSQVASYTVIAAKTGDTIKVTATCNIHGAKTVESKVEDIPAPLHDK